METIYFVRHAKSDITHIEDSTRPLTAQGKKDVVFVTNFFKEKTIDAIYSSPYKRAIDTISDYANVINQTIELIEDVREREIGAWVDDFNHFARKQWEDLDYTDEHGESLRQVQTRNIKALFRLLEKHHNQAIIIAGHGTAISTMIHYFYPVFKYSNFKELEYINPFILKMVFENKELLSLELINPLTDETTAFI